MTRKRIEELLAREGPRIRKRFRQVMQRVKDQRSIAELETALAEGRIAEVLDDVEAAAKSFAERVTATHLAVAHEVAGQLTAKLDKLVTYDASNERAVKVLRETRGRLITAITEEQRATIIDALAEGTSAGKNPREQARAIRETLGLTRKQATAVRAYRRQLEQPPPAPAAAEGEEPKPAPKPRDPKQVERMVDKAAARALNRRAETVARTEALGAVHEGMYAAYGQAIETGTLPAEQIERKWLAGDPPRTRAHHAAMDGQTRPWGEPFVSGHGVALMHPGQAGAPADEVVNCRCAVAVRVLAVGKKPASSVAAAS